MKRHAHNPGSSLRFRVPFWRTFARKLRQRIAVIAIGTFVGVSILVGCSKAPEALLRVVTNLWPGYETLHLAQSLGYYKETLIQLVDLPSGSEEVRAFRNGNIEAAGILLDQALVLATTNPDVRIVTVMDFSEGGDVVLAKPEFFTLKAMNGNAFKR